MVTIQYKKILQSRIKGSNDKWETEFSFTGNDGIYLSEANKDQPHKEFRINNNPKYFKPLGFRKLK